MKFVPMIVALSVGTVAYADAFGLIDGTPYSLMHPKSPRHKVAIDLTDAPKDTADLAPAVIEHQIDWTTDIHRAAMTGDTETEEEKKLFWHTEWQDSPGVPFEGWGDPNALNYPVWSATRAPGTAGIQFAYYASPVTESRHSEVGTAELPPPNPVFAPVLAAAGKVRQTVQTIQEQVIEADPILTVLCAIDSTLPACLVDSQPEPGGANTPPTLPGLPVTPPGLPVPPPVVVGVGGGMPGGQAGAVPEPSTWAMLLLGFTVITWYKGLLGTVWRGQARQGRAWLGSARQGKARETGVKTRLISLL